MVKFNLVIVLFGHAHAMDKEGPQCGYVLLIIYFVLSCPRRGQEVSTSWWLLAWLTFDFC